MSWQPGVIDGMACDLWVDTGYGGLVRADQIVRIKVGGRDLVIVTSSMSGGGHAEGRWGMDLDQHQVCSVDDLEKRTAQRADRRFAGVLAQALADGVRGVVEVRDGKFIVQQFRLTKATDDS